MRLGGALLILLVASAPLAAAASVSGALSFPQGADLRAQVTFAAAQGALDLSGAHPTITFTHATGWLVTRGDEFTGPPGGAQVFRGSSGPTNDSIDLAGGVLDSLTCAKEQCRAVLVADDAGEIDIVGEANGALASRSTDDAYHSYANSSAAQNFYYKTSAGWIVATTRDLGASDARATGALTLFLANASMRAGDRTLDAMPRDDPVTTGPLATGERTESRFIVLRLDGAQLMPGAGEATLVAPAPNIAVEGALVAAAAEGRLVVAGTPRDLHGESVRLDGSLQLTPSTSGVALAGQRPLGSVLSSAIAGDAAVTIAGTTVAARSTQTIAVVAGAAAILVVAGILFYTRLTRGALMDNPRRRLIHDTIRARPGSTPADLVRATSITEVVVRHHLRVLEEHGLVVVRGEGKLRAYFALDGASDAQSMALTVALKDPTRRRVAEAVARAAAPVSQRELVASLGLSQRLVSYHLSKLEEGKLVLGSGAMPRRYQAAAALSDHVDPAEPVAA